MKPSPLIDALDEAHFGGKAASLARSLRAGLPVPPGFALGTTHVEAVFDGHAEALTHLRAEFAALAGPCAVRSSAIGEDSEGASFAGQHVTILNVRHEDHVVDAVLKVRESAHTESARAYRRTLGMDEAPRVGVVVQRMIEPDCAGVMFTKNPLNGSDERVIEASWGLGEAVVAGLVVPDNYALDAQGRVLRRTAGEKDIALRGAPEGGTVEEAGRRRPRHRLLPERRDAGQPARPGRAVRILLRQGAGPRMGLRRRHALPAAVPGDDAQPVSAPALDRQHEKACRRPRSRACCSRRRSPRSAAR